MSICGCPTTARDASPPCRWTPGTQYLQGTVQTVVTNPQNGLALTDMVSGRNTAYLLTDQAAVRYNGKTARLSDVPAGAFATLRLSNGYVTWMDAYPGAANTVKGVLDTISYGDVITLRVRTDSGETASVTGRRRRAPHRTRDGQTGSLESLRTGDTVVLTLQGGAGDRRGGSGPERYRHRHRHPERPAGRDGHPGCAPQRRLRRHL